MNPLVGAPLNRVDGRLKVTGAATYSAETVLPGLAYGVIVLSSVAGGRIAAIDDAAVRRMPGVIEVMTPSNAPRVTASGKDVGYPADYNYREYYRDIGYDLDQDYLEPFQYAKGVRTHTGIKYHRITGPAGDKHFYNPDWARESAERHARDFAHVGYVPASVLLDDTCEPFLHSGILPCFLRGLVSFLFSRARREVMMRARVSAGSMMASM